MRREKAWVWVMRYLLQDNPGSPVATQESSCRSRNAQPIPLQSHRQRKTAPKIGSSSVAVYDYRNRVYSAGLGRFLQTDPIRFEAGDGNLYRYVFNFPTIATDPFGKAVLVFTPSAAVGVLAVIGCILYPPCLKAIRSFLSAAAQVSKEVAEMCMRIRIRTCRFKAVQPRPFPTCVYTCSDGQEYVSPDEVPDGGCPETIWQPAG